MDTIRLRSHKPGIRKICVKQRTKKTTLQFLCQLALDCSFKKGVKARQLTNPILKLHKPPPIMPYVQFGCTDIYAFIPCNYENGSQSHLQQPNCAPGLFLKK